MRFALILILVVIVGVYFGFTKRIPFKHGFQLKAQFSTRRVNIHSKSPVRIAGVDVGKVSSIKREGNTGLVTMEIEDRGLPIHADATVKIRPRIFLEGNWFVELQPGSPSANTVSSGYTLPITADRRPGAARPGAQRAQHRHAREPAEVPDLLRRRPDQAPERRRKRRTAA